MGEPLSRAFDWPRRQNIRTSYLGMTATPKTTPSPVFCLLAQIGSKRVPFHISKHAKQVIFLFDRKRLKAALVQMTGSFGVMVRMPSHCMGVGQPAKKSRHLIFVLGAYNEVPVIGHYAVSKDR
jgi:hypothetical protein